MKLKSTFYYAGRSSDDVLAEFGVDDAKGLSSSQVAKRLAECGTNSLGSRQVAWWLIMVRQLKSPFIYLLLLASVITFFLKEYMDSGMILLFLLINTFLGFIQEYRSEKTLQLLKKYVTCHTTVRRNSKVVSIIADQLVPGDIVVLKTGDQLPADIRWLETVGLSVDESVLTGESVAIVKSIKPLAKVPTEYYRATNLGFSGTTVVDGEGVGVVLATGRQTAMGKISRLAIDTRHVSTFEKGIAHLSSFILRLIVLTLVIVFIANLLIKGARADFLELLVFSIALAISVIPEALPLVTTFSLSRGALHLAKKKVVVKRLSAIEDLGSIEVLCTDKTGTITQNKLKVEEVYANVPEECLWYANLASNQSVNKTEPFDIALWHKIKAVQHRKIDKVKRLVEVPFNPERRYGAVVVKNNGKTELILRGAPEAVIKACSGLSASQRSSLRKFWQQQGEAGCRVLAVAKKEISENFDQEEIVKQPEKLAKQMEYVGLVSFFDPIKPDTAEAVAKANHLGIRIKILTGDSLEVATAVAKKVGLVSSNKEVMSGSKFMSLPPAKQLIAVEEIAVFARVAPEEKHKIIQTLQKKYAVGFLGEGINDAPALKAASVSLVVDGASDIAREVSDVILLQKSLQVIIDGIREGRVIFANTTKYIKATLASNFGNFYAVAIASLLIDFLPMLPLQILLLNLLSDFPMIGIAADNVDHQEVAKPRQYQIRDILVICMILGLISTVFDFLFFVLFYRISPQVLQTNWFVASILTELVLLFSIRTTLPVWRAKIAAAPLLWLTGIATVITLVLPFTYWGHHLFSFITPQPYHLLLIIALVGIYFVCTEATKLFYYRLENNKLK